MYFNGSDDSAKIVGGVEAKPNQYPWLVRLQLASYLCGGSIISSRFILTAAHCTNGRSASQITIYFADHSVSGSDPEEFSRGVTRIIQHPQFNSFTFDYDFALLEIAGDAIDFTKSLRIQKICLPTNCDDEGCATNSMASIAGWGNLGEDLSGGSVVLQNAQVEIQDQSTCRSQYGSSSITDRMLCAGYVDGGIDTCQGDSGGPLMTNEDGAYRLCGVVSWGYGCARPNQFGVYAKVCQITSWLQVNNALD